MNRVQHLDCTIRDGGYLNDWDFSFEFVYRLIRVLDESGFDYAEVGFWNPNKPNSIPWQHCPLELLERLDAQALRLKLALLVDFGSCGADDFPDALHDQVGLIRIAAHKAKVPAAVELAKALAGRGFEVTINAMGITSYSKLDLLTLGNAVHGCADTVKFFYVADSFGGLVPAATRRIFDFLRSVSDAALGFHPHNNLELAVANTLEAIDCGAGIVDSSLLGLGRGGGNLRSEIIAAVLADSEGSRLSPLPVLSYADAAFDTVGRDLGLGYDLEQIITGMAKCHPNYASRLMSSKRLSLDEVFATICALPDDRKGSFDIPALDAVRAERVKASIGDGGEPAKALKSSASTRATLICPGTQVAPGEIDKDSEVFGVNHLPLNKGVSAVIFGSVRRLWQVGDPSQVTRVFLAGTKDRLKSYPAAINLDPSEVLERFGSPIENSGILALALLLEAGFEQVQVFGMSGFRQSAKGDTNLTPEASGNLDDEAVASLERVRAAYAPLERHFELHGPTIFEGF